MKYSRTAFLALLAGSTAAAADLRLGLVGTDTSHVTAFAKMLNDPSSADHVPGARIVAAYKGGMPDNATSAKYIEQYTEELRSKWGVEIVPDIASLCNKVDGVLLTSVDGRPHLKEARQIFTCGKPVWIDKPLASTLEDAREIARSARESGVKWWTSSSLRFTGMITRLKVEGITGAMTWGPGPFEEHHHLDLSWYAIHPIEMLYALMGPGCVEVTRTYTEGADVIAGRWKDGRIGTVRAARPYGPYGAVVFRGREALQSDPNAPVGYRDMVVEIVRFFQTGIVPVPVEESLEIFAFMDAALRSKQSGGQPQALR
ncbi:MAG: Gfo/Idh/MocA family oxidoreductase [Bryobacterales bacterium]|nr:Gfo/Idh/MocA family oxidoreductase [Bryobacterales bacterium]